MDGHPDSVGFLCQSDPTRGAGAPLTYLHGDHLGGVSLSTNAAGQKVSEQRYKPYGEVRWSSGAGMPSDFTFTGQRAGPADYVGSLMDYVARGYSPALCRFVSADTIVPGAGNPKALNRYDYVSGNPLRRTDPTGHADWCPIDPANQSQQGLCPATGETAAWETYLKEQLRLSALGREMLDKDPSMFDRIAWDWSSLVGDRAISWPGRDVAGGKAYVISLNAALRDSFRNLKSLDVDKIGLIGHEIFHVFQRRQDKSRDGVFTTKNMEREAYVAGEALASSAAQQRKPGSANTSGWMKLLISSPAWMADSVIVDLGGTLFGKSIYYFAAVEEKKSASISAAFTVDMGFAKSVEAELYAAAGLKVP